MSRSAALTSKQSAFARPSVVAQRTARFQRCFRTTFQPSAFKFLKELGFEKPSWLPSFKKEVGAIVIACMHDATADHQNRCYARTKLSNH